MFIEYVKILNDAKFKDYDFDPVDRIVRGRATFEAYFTLSESITGWKVTITDYHNYDYSWSVPDMGLYGLSTAVSEMMKLIGELKEIVKRANENNFYAPMRYADFNRYDGSVVIAFSSAYGSVIKICTARKGYPSGFWTAIGGTPKMSAEIKRIVREVRGDDKCGY